MALFITAALFAQGCSRGVSPTSGLPPLIDAPVGGGVVTEALCQQQTPPDGDDDNDGICNADEVAAGLDPNNADTGNTGISDGDKKPLLSKWWFWFGTAALGTSGYIVARNKQATGKWWFRAPSANTVGTAANEQNMGLFFVPLQDNGEVEFKNTSRADEKFYQKLDEDGIMTKHILSYNEVEITGNAVFSAGSIAVKKGSRLLSCFHGAQVGTAVASAAANRYHVSTYFKDKYIKVGTKIPKYTTLNEFKQFCENRTGIFLGIQALDGVDKYESFGVPTELFDHIIQDTGSNIPAGYKSGVTTAYKFEQDINTYLANNGNSLNGLKYYRHFPGFDDDQHSTVDHQFANIAGTTAPSANSLETFKIGIQQSSDAAKKTADADLFPEEIELPEGPGGGFALMN